VAKFRYFGKTLTNRNCDHEGIKGILNSGECLLLFFPDDFYVFRRKHRLRVFENILLPSGRE
jgi:hypothetical protein